MLVSVRLGQIWLGSVRLGFFFLTANCPTAKCPTAKNPRAITTVTCPRYWHCLNRKLPTKQKQNMNAEKACNFYRRQSERINLSAWMWSPERGPGEFYFQLFSDWKEWDYSGSFYLNFSLECGPQRQNSILNSFQIEMNKIVVTVFILNVVPREFYFYFISKLKGIRL